MKIKITPDSLDEKKRKKKKKKSGGKKDACYHKVKSRYKVWPSAYASGALVKCRKVGAKNWGTGGKKNEELEINEEDLTDSEETDLKKIKKQLSKSAKKHPRQAKQATDIAKASAKSSEFHPKQLRTIAVTTHEMEIIFALYTKPQSLVKVKQLQEYSEPPLILEQQLIQAKLLICAEF